MNKKVLVVEDDKDVLEAIRLVMTEAGYRVEAALDGSAAHRCIAEDAPDLIILDLLLSGSNGGVICATLKSTPSLKGIPIIMMSAHPGARDVAVQSGADGFVAKPFGIDELVEVADKHIGSALP